MRIFSTLFLTIITSIHLQAQATLVDFVDPFIGVLDDASNCVLGPQLPFGSVNPSPHTKNGSQDCYSSNEPIKGFAQLHVSGTGWGKYGMFLISPQIGLATDDDAHDSDKSDESALAYEYGVTLSRYGIRAEMTPSLHSVIYRFTFPESDDANIVLDLSHTVADIVPNMGGGLLKGNLQIEKNSGEQISGYGQYVGGFGDTPYRVYFCAQLSKKPHRFGTWADGVVRNGENQLTIERKGHRAGCYLNFKTKKGEEVYLKIGISLKSIDQAAFWLENEIKGFDYEGVKAQAKQIWSKRLDKIKIEADNERDKTIFYTAFYHTSLMPRNRTNDSEFFGKDIPVWDDHFTVWDTWRTLYPLFALIDADVVASTIGSFVARLEKNGCVKDAYIACTEMMNEQGGNNVDNIIADAFVKGIEEVDWQRAYSVIRHNAENERQGCYGWDKSSDTDQYRKQGWIYEGIMSNSMTLEYAYNDYCATQLAKKLGTKEEYRRYLERSGKWINLWNRDAESDNFRGFIDSRRSDGSFANIDPKFYPGSWGMHFYEGSSWSYSWFAPHQFPVLIDLCGGKERFVAKLKHGFENDLIDYGNEPAFLSVFGFLLADRPDLTSYYIRKLVDSRFDERGYSGNDDSGAMSSWYMFASMGLFPNAGQDIYYLQGPKFRKTMMQISNGKVLTIMAPNASSDNIYVKEVKLNGKKINRRWIKHSEIASGGVLEFDMSSQP